MKYTKNFKKTIWGFATIEAGSEEEAIKKFEDGEYDEFDNKSDYEWDEEIKEG